ncbi:23.6 kDa heat shock protein [Cardamine amara subsp. amara]|uniref:23.6 kDa heat shock protein n=1 Tax=Cardamine amara subsp. amara TaxID=228776 RepID=A0ABD1A500_CARAN
MASSLAIKRLLSSTVVPCSRSVLRPAISSRLLNTNAVRSYDDGDGIDLERRSDRSVSHRRDDFFPDVFDPFSSTRSVSQVLNLMDQLMENPLISATRGMGASGVRRGWDIKEKDDALHLRIDMPGLSREDVKLALEQDTLVIRGEGKDEDGAGESGNRRFTSRIGLPEKIYKVDEIKAEMKNGVLKVVIPKMKEEERNDVHQIQVN